MITKFGKQKLEEELHNLESELARTVEERAKAAAEGDLKENSAYIFLGERAEVLRSQIGELKSDLKEVTVKTAPQHTDKVDFGHRVTVLYESDNRELTITLVGRHDSRYQSDWISCDSPLGLAIFGKKVQETVFVNGQAVRILDISIAEI
ncbi:MAG: GreA/GreB family elongation factor [Patescibacteria group bacterium]|jgi:transcription elongation factor GreA